jgi:uncharacterized membrane protein YqjE
MAKEERGLSTLTWALIGLIGAVTGLVAVAIWSPYRWGWILMLGVFVAPAVGLVIAAWRWRKQHVRFGEMIAEIRGRRE